MLDYAFEIFDGIVACFTSNLSWRSTIATFWFLFFVDFPRYYLLDFVAAGRHGFTWRSRRKKRELARRMLYIEKPFISILVPGKNEGKHIYALLKSIREQTYTNYEIIIIDDGSDDTTPMVCRDLDQAGLIDKYYRLFDRGGKASAANYGAYYAKGKYIVHMDADSSLDRDAIEKILIPFYYDRRIKGVGGCVKVRNAYATVCTAMQALEYLRCILIGRMVTNMFGLYHIISGAFGAFEAETIRQLGCWDVRPGMDGDITQKIRKAGYKVWFAEDSICMTNVPEKWKDLYLQRYRWSKSLVRFRIRKHRDIFRADKNFSFSNMFSNLDCIFYDFILNYIWFFYIITLIFANTDRLWEIIVVAWLIRFSFTLLAFLVIQCVSERAREERALGCYLLLSTLYIGYFLRTVRLIGHTAELFFFSSYKDRWNPKKTSIVARVEHI